MVTLAVRPCDRALGIANETRAERAELRSRVRRGTLSLEDVLLPAHPLVAGLPLADVLRWQYHERHTSITALERLGRLAVRDDVNLMIRAGRASESSRRCVVRHGRHRGHGRGV